MDKIITLKNNFGFSIVELLVTLVIMSIIMGTVYLTFGSQRNIFANEEKKLDMQLNSRVAMDRLVWLFQHTGFGATDSFKNGAIMSGTVGSDTLTFNSMLSADNQDSVSTINSDNVTLVLGFRKVAEVNGDFNEVNQITLKNFNSPTITNTNFTRYLCFSPYTENSFFRVTNAASPTFTLNSKVRNLKDNTDVFMVAPIRITIQNNTLFVRNLAYSSINNWQVAEGIQDIQFQYTQDGGTTWMDNPTNPENVDAVRIFMLAQSTIQDPNYTNANIYQYAGKNVNLADDHFHRLLTTATVWLRNQ